MDFKLFVSLLPIFWYFCSHTCFVSHASMFISYEIWDVRSFKNTCDLHSFQIWPKGKDFVLCLFHLCSWQRIVTLIKDPAACHVWTIPFQRFFWGNPNTVCQFWQNYELKCVPHTSHSVDRQWSQSLVMFWITANTWCISPVKGGLDSTSRPISRQS